MPHWSAVTAKPQSTMRPPCRSRLRHSRTHPDRRAIGRAGLLTRPDHAAVVHFTRAWPSGEREPTSSVVAIDEPPRVRPAPADAANSHRDVPIESKQARAEEPGGPGKPRPDALAP